MIRGLWFFFQLAVVVVVGVLLAYQRGAVSIEFHGWLIETTTGMLIFSVLVAALLVILAWRILRSILSTPHAIGRLRRALRGFLLS